MARTQRIWFIQLLRGVAAILVVFFHYFTFFWEHNSFVAETFHFPAINNFLPFVPVFFSTTTTGFTLNLGTFAIALFFLISGFVIPLALEKLNGRDFLINRIFRIYPVYLAELVIAVVLLFSASKIFGSSFPFSPKVVLANTLLFQDLFHFQTINTTVWTLQIELKFYIICALAYTFSSFKNRYLLILISFILLFLLWSTPHVSGCSEGGINPCNLISSVGYQAPFLIFMLIGSGVYNLFRKYWSWNEFIIMTLIQTLLFCIATYLLSGSDTILTNLLPFALAEISFFVLFKQSKKIKYSAPLNFMAEISYPLYLVHTTTGYLIITLVYLRFQSPLLSILIALTSCIALAYVLHILIEIPGQKLGKSLISRLRVQLPKAARN